MRVLLDANLIGPVADCDWRLWPNTVLLAVAGTVDREARNGRDGRRSHRERFLIDAIAAGRIQKLDVMYGTLAFRHYRRLCGIAPGPARRDRGERESIALALEHGDVGFATADLSAHFRARSELGAARAVHPLELPQILVADGLSQNHAIQLRDALWDRCLAQMHMGIQPPLHFP